jgi:hypothetical protein
MLLSCLLVVAAGAAGQTLLDRVLIRVGAEPIFVTDVRAAIGLGVVDPSGSTDPEAAALDQLVDRQLMMVEILRGVPPEPDAGAVAEEVERMKSFAAATLENVMSANGLDETFLRRTARDTLRIQLYLDARFPQLLVSDGEAQQYYTAHPEAFRRNGVLMTFDQAIGPAREQASRERRRTRIAQWLAGLRKRTEIVRPTGAAAAPSSAPAAD